MHTLNSIFNTKNIFRISALLAVLLTLILNGFNLSAATDRIDTAKVYSQMNEFIIQCKQDGTLDELNDKWIENLSDECPELDYSKLTGENGHIIFGTTTQKPFSFINNGTKVGFTIELLYRFCLKYGYDIEFYDYSNSGSLITAIQMGNCDFGGGNNSVTEDRKKIVSFTETYFNNSFAIVTKAENASVLNSLENLANKKIGTITGSTMPDIIRSQVPNAQVYEYNTIADLCIAVDNGIIDGICYDYAVVKSALKNYPDLTITTYLNLEDTYALIFRKMDDTTSESTGFFEKIKNSFVNNFIDGQRYKILLTGIYNTLLITVTSIILGTLLGFIVYMTTKKQNPVIRVFSWLVDGLPAVVLLMILFYVIFSPFGMGATIVSIITFTLIFGSSTLGLLKTSVGAIDRGQFEASYALGYKKNEAFFKMILPQALEIAWPGYIGSITTQIKATAIVGYIAVQDLTKAGDMIRSSTFEAFFPLIVIAIIYLLLAWILSLLVGIIGNKFSKSEKKSRKFLEGVIINDRT